MSKAKLLTKQVAEQFIEDCGKFDLSTYTSIQDDAAKVLALHKRRLDLHGLKTLSDSAALALSKHKGPIYLVNVTHLSDSAASALACHEGHLQLWGLSEISDAGLSAMSARYDRGHCHWSATLTKRLKNLAKAALPQSDENCPVEWVNDSVVLPPPISDVRWITQSALSKYKDIPTSFFQWFTPFLPAAHVREVDRGRSKTSEISEQAADLLVNNKAFFASVRATSSRKKRQQSSQVISHQMGKSASQAGLSKAELEAKLKRLGDLVKSGRLDLVAEMIAGFGGKWLYEALLSDSEVTEEGALKLGQPLKQFGSKGPIILLLAIAYMPVETERHGSLNRKAVIRINVGSDEIDVVAAMLSPCLCGLTATCSHFSNSKLPRETAALLAQVRDDLDLSSVDDLDDAQADALACHEGGLRLDGLTSLQATTARYLARNKGELSLAGISSLNEATVRALAACHSGLCLGLIDLPESIAACLAKCRGRLQFPRIHQLTASAASALEQHEGALILGDRAHSLGKGCELDASAADCLSRHRGPVILHQKKRLHTKTALALSACQHGLGLPDLEEIPLGDVGVKLCNALALGLPGESMLALRLKSLQAYCAEALSAYSGHLCVNVEQWEESALIALAAHQGYLGIDPKKLTGPVARALGKRAASTSLDIQQYGTVSVDDDAAEALATYPGQLTFQGSLNLSVEAARHLSKRASIKILRSKIKPTVREIFEQLGSWSEGEWKRTDASS
jgi:hypothetical protein